MIQLTVDPKFRDKIPPSKPEEKERLEQNILADGEVREPIVTWNGVIIDGHTRWEIIQRHPEIPYTVKEMDFPDEWAAIAWMCRNQLGRRNINEATWMKLIQEEHDAMVKSEGAPVGNNRASKQLGENNQVVFRKDRNQTREFIAKEHNTSPAKVRYAVEFGRGLEEAEKVSPGIKAAVLSGEINVPKKEIADMRNMPDEEKKETVEAIKRGDYKPGKKKQTENQGNTRENRERWDTIRKVADELYDTEHQTAYTPDDLKEELDFIVQDFIKKAKRTLTIRSTVLNEPGAREKISAVLLEAETAVKEMKGLVL